MEADRCGPWTPYAGACLSLVDVFDAVFILTGSMKSNTESKSLKNGVCVSGWGLLIFQDIFNNPTFIFNLFNPLNATVFS